MGCGSSVGRVGLIPLVIIRWKRTGFATPSRPGAGSCMAWGGHVPAARAPSPPTARRARERPQPAARTRRPPRAPCDARRCKRRPQSAAARASGRQRGGENGATR
eukprot:6096218-Prymnesium_polylepis.1